MFTYNYVCTVHVRKVELSLCVTPFPVQGVSQEKDALAKELSDLKEELIVAEQEKDKAMKIAEDFEYKLEIERTKLLKEVTGMYCI